MNLPSLSLPDPSKPIEDQDLLVLFAMCIFGEARGESLIARRAVAQVVLNRAQHPHVVFGSKNCGQFDANLRAVILRPGQFSSLYPGDPNYQKLWFPLAHSAPQVWERCLQCASDALAAKDCADTLTANSDHYFDDSILPPSWASPAKQTVKIGRLNFFRLYLPHPGEPSPENAPPSSGSSPDASLRPLPRKELTETQNPACDLSAGSHPSAKILPERATTLPACPALPQGLPGSEPAGPEETPATGPQSPRPPMSSPAPKSLCALICGPRSYPWYGWGRRLSLLTGNLFRYVLEHLTSRAAAVNKFTASAVRARFQPCRNTSRENRASAPEVHPVSAHIPSTRRGFLFPFAPRLVSESGILNSEFVSSLVLGFRNFTFRVLSAPQRRTVNSRSFKPMEQKPSKRVQSRTGLPILAATRALALPALLAFVLFAAACSDMEKNAYRVLAVTQAEYETLQDKAAESAARNLISEQQWERFQVLGHRFIAAHNSAVDAFALWSKSKQPADTARLQAMLDLLPGLIADINALVQSFSAPNLVPQLSPNGTTIPVPADPAIQPQLDRPSDPEPRPVRIIPSPGNHGDRLLRRGSVFSSAIAR